MMLLAIVFGIGVFVGVVGVIGWATLSMAGSAVNGDDE